VSSVFYFAGGRRLGVFAADCPAAPSQRAGTVRGPIPVAGPLPGWLLGCSDLPELRGLVLNWAARLAVLIAVRKPPGGRWPRWPRAVPPRCVVVAFGGWRVSGGSTASLSSGATRMSCGDEQRPFHVLGRANLRASAVRDRRGQASLVLPSVFESPAIRRAPVLIFGAGRNGRNPVRHLSMLSQAETERIWLPFMVVGDPGRRCYPRFIPTAVAGLQHPLGSPRFQPFHRRTGTDKILRGCILRGTTHNTAGLVSLILHSLARTHSPSSLRQKKQHMVPCAGQKNGESLYAQTRSMNLAHRGLVYLLGRRKACALDARNGSTRHRAGVV